MSENRSIEINKSSKLTREWIQIVILLFATGLGAYEFILKDIIRPAQEPTALELDADLQKVGEMKNKFMIRARISAKNPTERRIYVPAFWFTVTAYRFSSSTKPIPVDYTSALENAKGDELISAYFPVESGEVVAQKRLVHSGTAWWEPEDKTNDEAIFVIPSGKFDFLELQVKYLFTRDNSRLGAPKWYALEDGHWEARFQFKGTPAEETEIIEWQLSTGSGHNWHITTLPLWHTD